MPTPQQSPEIFAGPESDADPKALIDLRVLLRSGHTIRARVSPAKHQAIRDLLTHGAHGDDMLGLPNGNVRQSEIIGVFVQSDT